MQRSVIETCGDSKGCRLTAPTGAEQADQLAWFHDKTLEVLNLEFDPERPHGLKYSLYYGRAGERIVGYDNERGKGDHKHVEGREKRYRFVSVEQLVADFLADVERIRRLELQQKE